MDVILLEIRTDVGAKGRKRTVDMGLDGARRDTESQRHVCFGQVAEVAQHDRLSLATGQVAKGGDEGDAKHDVVRLVPVMGTAPHRRATPQVVEGFPGGDLEHPGVAPAKGPDRAQRAWAFARASTATSSASNGSPVRRRAARIVRGRIRRKKSSKPQARSRATPTRWLPP